MRKFILTLMQCQGTSHAV